MVRRLGGDRPPFLGDGAGRPPELSEDEYVGLYLLWRHGGVEPHVAWGQWPSWQFDLLSNGLREELEVASEAREKGGEASEDPLQRVQSRAPDWDEADALLEGLEA